MSEGRPAPVREPDFGVVGDEAPTQQLALSAVGDRCVNCGAPLSSDQRYCVNCGERRTKPRFSLAQEPGTGAETAAAPPRRPRGQRAPAGGTFVAGVATLLLAMGVGVLIGRTNNNAGSSAQRVSNTPAVQVVTVGAGSGATAAAGNPSSNSAVKSKSGSRSRSAAKSKAAAKPNAAAAAKAAASASKVLGGGTKLPPATVTVGASGSGPGYQNGKFNGTYFGQ